MNYTDALWNVKTTRPIGLGFANVGEEQEGRGRQPFAEVRAVRRDEQRRSVPRVFPLAALETVDVEIWETLEKKIGKGRV